jgi:hypothetical protein
VSLREYARWPVAAVRVLWNRLPGGPPVHRTQERGDPSDLPVPVPPDLLDDYVQRVADGTGDLLHRRYSVVVDGARTGPEELLRRFADDPNCAVPDVALFVQTRGAPGPLREGAEYRIRMPGPWDGPVRVIGIAPRSLRLATLWGHLEAGQIEFRTAAEADGALSFTIESWARAGDRVSRLLYDRLPLAKEIQLTVWVQTCLDIAELAGGVARDGVRVHTRRVPAALVARPPAGV